MNSKHLIEIQPLRETPDYAPILAHWSFCEWYLNRKIPFHILVKNYQVRARNDTVPLSFIAMENTVPVGMASLKNDDLWTRKDLNPWLASLYVLPAFRNKGIGNMLIAAVTGKAKDLGFDRIYLFLGQSEQGKLEHYYFQRKWKFLEDSMDNDGEKTKIFFYETL
ncbi:MAG: GNAT family N-acetyltransferase [bacterium]|nr:GNAT family N-acetyltransferase [bacterium]